MLPYRFFSVFVPARYFAVSQLSVFAISRSMASECKTETLVVAPLVIVGL